MALKLTFLSRQYPTRWRGRDCLLAEIELLGFLRTPPPPFPQAVAVQFRVNDLGKEIVIAKDLYSVGTSINVDHILPQSEARMLGPFTSSPKGIRWCKIPS